MSDKQLENQVEETEEREEEEDDGKPQVAADDEGGVTVKVPERPTRKDRRAQRGRDRYEEVAQEARRAREEAERYRREMDELRTQIARGFDEVRRGPQRTEEDPYKSKLEDIRREQESIQSAFRAGNVSSNDEIERLRRRYYELEDRRTEVIEERLESRIAQKYAQQEPRGGSHEAAVLQAEFPEVVADQRAMRYAVGLYQQYVAEGKPGNLTTSREVMRKAAERFGLGAPVIPPQPSENQRLKYGAVPAQAGAKAAPSGVRLTKDQQRMAVAAYPSLSEEEAYTKWVRDIWLPSQRDSAVVE